jgi:hypothetical protein
MRSAAYATCQIFYLYMELIGVEISARLQASPVVAKTSALPIR